jgi:hypothetical protein
MRMTPMTAKRTAIFQPLATKLARQLDRTTGGTGEEKWVSPPPRPFPSFEGRPAEAPQRVATKLMQCETCGANVALLIFADDATDRGGLEDYARLDNRPADRERAVTAVARGHLKNLAATPSHTSITPGRVQPNH